MEVLHPRCAGLDVHKDTVVACVRCVTAPKANETRTFATTTRELLALSDWLASHGCTHAAMESTGVYWRPVWHVLESRFELVLANAQHIREVANLHFPGFGEEAMRMLVQQRGVAAVGLDTASLDPGRSTEFQAHRVAAEAGVPGFENLTNLDQVPAKGAWLVALPMLIEGGSGAPLRAVALVP